jgi:hypothetical protein
MLYGGWPTRDARTSRFEAGEVDEWLNARCFGPRRGGGAYLNGGRIAVSEVSGLDEAIVGVADFKVGVGSEDENRVHLAVVARLARESLRVRMIGSAALDLAWLAVGRLNATVMLSNLPWDVHRGAVARPRSRRDGLRLRRLRSRFGFAVHARLGSVIAGSIRGIVVDAM